LPYGAGAAASFEADMSSSWAAYRSLMRLSHASVQYFRLDRVRVPGPDEVPADMSPAVQVDQVVRLLPRRLVNGIEVAGDHQPPRAAVLLLRELAG
jgi:hypothetical protein